ncbi:helix-turn-helix domain-containing protein [Bordetella muralis]|jgi:AraC-like DNA-binding protein|uniref:helix-turn-helix domain-containing protein n=1 Tax=Bordetella muralis TaxID=1649130 RepID=UPI0039EFC048
MHSDLYFIVASLSTLEDLPSHYIDMMRNGDIKALEKSLATAVEAIHPEANNYDLYQAYADILMVLGRSEEAEQSYRHALKHIYDDRERYRRKSSRNAAWQAFSRHRYHPAIKGFKRLAEHENTSDGELFEARIALAMLAYCIGNLTTAWEHLGVAQGIAQRRRNRLSEELVQVMKRELILLFRLRTDPAMADHVFWQSGSMDHRVPPDLLAPEDTSGTITSCSLLNGCIQFFRRVEDFMQGHTSEPDDITLSLTTGTGDRSLKYLRTRRLTIAMATLCTGMTNRSEQTLENVEQASAFDRASYWHLDYLYILAALKRKQGRWHEFSETYTRYTLLAMKHARAADSDAAAVAPHSGVAVPSAMSDDITSRLIGKYRRAYSYIVDNLQQPDLSVREVAAQIGVTERTLQLTFRSSLGMTPMELIRRLRMERIHQDLLTQDASGNVLAVASKWGVRHRSTLANSYRKVYKESPSETRLRIN